ncbi:unnamed protein product, partial [Prorocentrum cordatum]
MGEDARADREFVAFAGQGHRLGIAGEIVPSRRAPPAPGAAPAAAGPAEPPAAPLAGPSEPHPLLVPGVIALDSQEPEGPGGEPEYAGPPVSSYMAKVEEASKYVTKFTDLITVASSWLECLEDNTWNQRLRADVWTLLQEMNTFTNEQHDRRWSIENIDGIVNDVRDGYEKFNTRVLNLKKCMPQKLSGCDETKEGDADEDEVDEKALFGGPDVGQGARTKGAVHSTGNRKKKGAASNKAAADKGEKKRAATGKAAADKPSTPDKSNGKKKKKAKGKPKAKPTLKRRNSARPLEMPPKRAAAKLSSVACELTEEEIEAARRLLAAADQKKINSIKQGLKAFVNANPDSEITKENRYTEKYMMAFLAHQARCSDAQKSAPASKEVITGSSKFTDVVRMSVEAMDREIGPTKAAPWRTVLKAYPDSLTGRTEPEYLEYAVPKNWERMTEQEMKKFLVTAGSDASQDDVEQAMRTGGPNMELMDSASSSSGVNPTAVKVEPADAEEQKKKALALKVAKVESDLPLLVREFQDMNLDVSLIRTKAKTKNDPYHAEFRSDVEACLKKMKSTKSILERMHTEQASPSEIPKLIDQMEMLRSKYTQIVEFSKNNGYKDEDSKKR